MAQRISKRAFLKKNYSWEINDNGSFTVSSGNLRIEDCYPAIDGRAINPVGIKVSRSIVGGTIHYNLEKGETIVLTLAEDSNTLILKSKLIGFKHAPEYFCPLAQGLIKGADRFYKQGIGFAGPSGVFPIPEISERIDKNGLFEVVFSYDSYIASGVMDTSDNTLVIGAYDHKDYLQRTTIYNRHNRMGLVDRWEALDRVFYEAGFSTECIPVSGAELVLPDLHVYSGAKPYQTFRQFASFIASHNRVNLKQKPAYHWCSWYDTERDFNETVLNDLLDGLKAIQPKVPIQTVQIDDGYFQYYGDWLRFDTLKFPSGFENAIRQITESGLRPGIWVGPFMIHEKSEIYKQHPDWVLKKADGSINIEWPRPDGNVMVLDASNPEAFEYLRQVFRSLRKLGITYYKTDFIDWGLKNSTRFKRFTPGKTSVQYYYDVLKMIREEIGDDSFWLACIAPFPPTIGLVDAARNSNDVGREWSEGSHGNMLNEGYYTQILNNSVFQNDPDVSYFNAFNTSLTDAEIKTIAYFSGISGGIVNTSDRFHHMPEQNLKLWRFIQPAPDRFTADVPFWDKPMRLKVFVRKLNDISWAVLVINSGETTEAESYRMADLVGVDKAFTFAWEPGKSKELGEQELLQQTLEKHSSVLYYISTNNTPPATNLGINGIAIEGL